MSFSKRDWNTLKAHFDNARYKFRPTTVSVDLDRTPVRGRLGQPIGFKDGSPITTIHGNLTGDGVVEGEFTLRFSGIGVPLKTAGNELPAPKEPT